MLTITEKTRKFLWYFIQYSWMWVSQENVNRTIIYLNAIGLIISNITPWIIQIMTYEHLNCRNSKREREDSNAYLSWFKWFDVRDIVIQMDSPITYGHKIVLSKQSSTINHYHVNILSNLIKTLLRVQDV